MSAYQRFLKEREARMAAAMKGNEEPDLSPRPMRLNGNLLVLVKHRLAILAFAVGGISGLLGPAFRLVLEGLIASAARLSIGHTKRRLLASCLFIDISAIATGLAAWLIREFAPGAKGSGIPDVDAALRDEQPPPPLILIPVKFFD